MKQRQVIGLLLLSAGILFMLWPIWSTYQKQATTTDLKQQWKKSLQTVDAKETTKPLATKGDGLLTIPSLDFEQVILEGASTDVLDRSIGHIKETGAPGKGNYALAGHRSFTKGLHFNKLPQLKTGADVIVTTKDHRYTYRMESSKLVKPTDLSVLDQNVKQPMITLITCDPPETATNRLIKQGVLIKTETLD
ncbi:class D sortase [Exiguobacterium sp. H66]|uniref:class D sortase n=1 Tax=Exiguobacterium sp. H66 TaxID=2751208 RepID=UPI001BEA0462|nr:class D sortase [Exiguobacterium sp. H66]